MKRKKIFWLIFPPFLFLFLCSIILIIWWSVLSFRNVYIDQQRSELLTCVRLLKSEYIDLKPKVDEAALLDFCLKASVGTKARITLISKAGYVMSDSHEDISRMGNHSDRPEFQQALKNNNGESIRYSLTLSSSLMYIAVLVESEGNKTIVLRISKPISEINDQLHKMYQDNFWMILILLMFTSMFIWKISRSISSPIEDLIKNINSMPKDNWKGISTNAHSDELLTLVESLNKMGLDSNHNLKRIEKDAEEQETIFRNMQEGIIALDKSDKIIKINDSALKMFNCQSSNPRGKSIEGLVRNQDFIKLLSDVKNEEQAIVVDINILDKIPKIIQINANCITDKSNNFSGSLFVLADITQVKKLESMKRDFVSNVSHELKTPLTSIKGYIETLLYSENLDSELTEKFLNKINKNSNRLQSIIEDLLILSKVEQKGLENEELEKVRLIEILNHIVEECQQKQLSVDSLKIECDKEIQIKVHRSLFTQALLNLLDNAYKYSDSIPEISILVEASDSSVAISISDRGQGIEEQHFPHLLERFYRVDKARSRDKGGTGLGLSIVKHIIQAHKGKVEIQSQIGKGSTFKVIIPKNNLTES